MTMTAAGQPDGPERHKRRMNDSGGLSLADVRSVRACCSRRPRARPRKRRHVAASPGGHASTRPALTGTPAPDWSRRYLPRVIAGDIAIAVVVSAVALVVLPPDPEGPLHLLREEPWWLFTPSLALLWPIVLLLVGAYERRYLGTAPEEYRAVGRAGVGLLACVAIGTLALKLQPGRVGIAVVLVGIMAQIPQLSWLRPFLVTGGWLRFADLLRDPVAWSGMGQGLVLQGAWIAVLLVAAWARMTSKDVTS